MITTHLLYFLKSFQARKRLGCFLPVLILLLLGGQPAYSDIIRSLAIDPGNSSTLYAGTNAGVFKSTDGGESWSAVNTGLPESISSGNYPAVISLAVDPASNSTVYAVISGYGVFKSTNGGGNWIAVSTNTGLPNLDWTHSLVIDPSSNVYVGLDYGTVYKDTNGGTGWNAADSGLIGGYHNCLTVDPRDSSTLYAAGQRTGIYKSTNGGLNWSAVNTGLPESVVSGNYPAVNSLAVDPASSSIVYAATSDGFYKSTNGGGSWSLANTSLTDSNSLTIDPANSSNLYAATNAGLFESADGGITWNAVNNGLSADAVSVLVFDPANSSTLYAGTNDGVFKSTDGGVSWSGVNSGLSANAGSASVADPPHGSNLYAEGQGTGVYKGVSSSDNWCPAALYALAAPSIQPTTPLSTRTRLTVEQARAATAQEVGAPRAIASRIPYFNSGIPAGDGRQEGKC